MAEIESLTCEELLEAEAKTWNLLPIANTTSILCAAQLGIPDVIYKHGKPMSVPQLLAALPAIKPSKAPYLHRLLRVLVHSGLLLLHKQGEGDHSYCYSLTAAGLLLQSNGRLSSLNDPDPFFLKAWTSMGAWFQNEEPTPFTTAYGENFWEFFARRPALCEFFNKLMAQDSQLIAKVLLGKRKHVFEGLTSLVDVGGGTGTIAKAIAEAFPKMECFSFDRPHVAANFHESHGVKFIGGDMLDKIPPANALLLKWILHDWSDEDCIKILKNCKEAIPRKEEGGKVIIIDVVMDSEGTEAEFVQAQLFLDMVMMVNLGSKERSKKEWEKLFLAAGFNDFQITPALGTRSLIELYH